MTAPLASGGLGFSDANAGSVYSTYASSVWTGAIFGGRIADRWLGQYRSVLLGGMFIVLGQFTLAVAASSSFYTGLILIVIGTGLLKPNVSTLVGSLYELEDDRRDVAFSIFYMGINLGGFIGPLTAGYLAQRAGWRVGFAIAGLGMTVGLIQYILGTSRLSPALKRIAGFKQHRSLTRRTVRPPLTSAERRRVSAIILLLIFAAVFWGAYEQAGSTLNLFADRYVRLNVFNLSLPSTWFQAVPSLIVIVLGPVFAWLWMPLGDHAPSSQTKFGFGLLFAGLAFLWLVPAGLRAQFDGARVSPLWLLGFYIVLDCGEMCLSPVGLSLVTKLAPVKLAGLMMGIWFLASAIGSKAAGFAAGLSETIPLAHLFLWTAGVCLMAAFMMFAVSKPVSKLIGLTRP